MHGYGYVTWVPKSFRFSNYMVDCLNATKRSEIGAQFNLHDKDEEDDEIIETVSGFFVVDMCYVLTIWL